MNQIKKLYYSIGEVSELTGLKQYVLRYWETEFPQLKPSKNSAGNRTYKEKDLHFINQIKDLLYNKKFTIKGALKHLAYTDSVVDINQQVERSTLNANDIIKIKDEISEIKISINKLKNKFR